MLRRAAAREDRKNGNWDPFLRCVVDFRARKINWLVEIKTATTMIFHNTFAAETGSLFKK